jgi:hypothetical protein
MRKDKPRAITRSELVLETWTSLNSESLGANELEEIQKELAARLGDSGVESPASIARSLADIGVPLRHPEVLDYDTVWRDAHSLDSLGLGELDFSTIEAAVISVKKLNTLRDRLKDQKDTKGLANMRTLVPSLRQQLRLIASSKTVSEQRKKVAVEAEQWLDVWLQNPRIFEDWLALRMNSNEFQTVFGK